MRRCSLAVLLAATLWPHQPGAKADSLWEKRSRNRAFLFYDSPFYEVGDILTIIINESTDVDNRERRNLNKSSGASIGTDFESSTSGGFGPQGASAELEASHSSSRDFEGEAAFTSEQEFSDRISVMVKEVQPNGNLLIAGERDVVVDGDTRKLMISGYVRRGDVRPDGTIDSRNVAQLKLAFPGQGENQKFIRQGWLSRGLNRIWPF